MISMRFISGCFPILCLISINGVSQLIFEPLGKEKTRIRFISLPIKGYKQSSGNNNSVDHIELEDQRVVLNVQKGIKSKFYDRGRYSAEHEKGTHHLHRLIAKYLKLNNK